MCIDCVPGLFLLLLEINPVNAYIAFTGEESGMIPDSMDASRFDGLPCRVTATVSVKSDRLGFAPKVEERCVGLYSS